MTAPNASRTHVRFLGHDGVRIVHLDFAGITDPKAGLAVVDETKAFMSQLAPDGTHYTLTDVRDTRYDREIVEAFRGLTAFNRPYVRAAAVVSNSALHRAAIAMIAAFSKRKLAVFATKEEALAYLVSEHRAARGARK